MKTHARKRASFTLAVIVASALVAFAVVGWRADAEQNPPPGDPQGPPAAVATPPLLPPPPVGDKAACPVTSDRPLPPPTDRAERGEGRPSDGFGGPDGERPRGRFGRGPQDGGAPGGPGGPEGDRADRGDRRGPPDPAVLFESMDTNKDGSLSKEEFMAWHASHRPPQGRGEGGPGNAMGNRGPNGPEGRYGPRPPMGEGKQARGADDRGYGPPPMGDARQGRGYDERGYGPPEGRPGPPPMGDARQGRGYDDRGYGPPEGRPGPPPRDAELPVDSRR